MAEADSGVSVQISHMDSHYCRLAYWVDACFFLAVVVQIPALAHSFVPMTGLGTTLEVGSDEDNVPDHLERSSLKIGRTRMVGVVRVGPDIHRRCSHSRLETES